MTTTLSPTPPTGVRLLFGREPAVWIDSVAAVLVLVASFGLPLSDGQTGAVLAVLTAAAGLFTAWAVQPVAPAVFLGLARAVLALVLAFGLDLSAAQQGSLLATATVVLTLVLRQQVSPPIAAGTIGEQSVHTITGVVVHDPGAVAELPDTGRHRERNGDGLADPDA